jgi:hypothetical protein
VLFRNYYSAKQIKEDVMGGTCRPLGEMKNSYKTMQSETLKVRVHLADAGVDRKDIVSEWKAFSASD